MSCVYVVLISPLSTVNTENIRVLESRLIKKINAASAIERKRYRGRIRSSRTDDAVDTVEGLARELVFAYC